MALQTQAEMDAENGSTGDIGSQELTGSQDSTSAPQASTSLSSASTLASDSGPKAPNQAGKGSASGQRFANLKKFVAKNKESQIGSKIRTDVQKEAKNVGSDINKANELFQQKAATEGARVAEGENLIGQEDFYGAGIADFESDTDNLDKFTQLRVGKDVDFSAENQRDIDKGIAGLKTSADNLGTEAGRFTQLKKSFGEGRNYTTGQSRLDQLLLQGNKREQQEISDLRGTLGVDQRASNKALQENIGATQSDLDTRKGIIKSNIDNTLFGTEEDPGLLKSVSTDYKNQLEEAKTRGRVEHQDVLAALKAGTISKAQADQLGITGSDIKNLYGVNASDFITEANVDQNRVMLMS